MAGVHLDGPARLRGTLKVPGSKSHTIRALLLAAMAEGTSEILHPLEADDTRSAVEVVRKLGAGVSPSVDGWRVDGLAPDWVERKDRTEIQVGNSGTSLYLAAALAALSHAPLFFDGDASIRRRSAAPLLSALAKLGAKIRYHRGRGFAPFTITGPIRPAEVELAAPTSQYLSALLLACPLMRGPQGNTVIRLTELNERPYVGMTLAWLERLGVEVGYTPDYTEFVVPNNQHYRPARSHIPADYSSATFFLCGAALSQSRFRLDGLAPDRCQGDSAVVDMLRRMGTTISRDGDALELYPSVLRGCELSLNDTPDALPALAVAACFAGGETRLVGVEQARIKETNRIEVMARELTKLGADVTERQDGLVIRGGAPLNPNFVSGHGDHRVIMALAMASLGISGGLTIDDVRAASVTFPSFFACLTERRELVRAS